MMCRRLQSSVMWIGTVRESYWSYHWLHNNGLYQYGVSIYIYILIKLEIHSSSYKPISIRRVKCTRLMHIYICNLAVFWLFKCTISLLTILYELVIRAVKRSNCFHIHGHEDKCSISNYPFMAIFAAIQIVLSQIPNFHKLSWLSIVAAVMSFAYSSIGLALSVAKVAGIHKHFLINYLYFMYICYIVLTIYLIKYYLKCWMIKSGILKYWSSVTWSGGGHDHVRTSLTGTTVGVDVTGSDKVWRSFQSIGDIAFAYAYSTVLIEIQASTITHHQLTIYNIYSDFSY